MPHPAASTGELFSCYCLFEGETTILESTLKPALLSPWDYQEKWRGAPATRSLLPGL